MRFPTMIRKTPFFHVFFFLIACVTAITFRDRIGAVARRTTGPFGGIAGRLGERVRAFQEVASDLETDLPRLRQSPLFHDLLRRYPSRSARNGEPRSMLHRDATRSIGDPGEFTPNPGDFRPTIFADARPSSACRAASGRMGVAGGSSRAVARVMQDISALLLRVEALQDVVAHDRRIEEITGTAEVRARRAP